MVKSKRASGGIDGISTAVFDDNLEIYLREISESLKLGKWIPEPYLRIEIPKKEKEKREIGLLSVKDKIVQQGIKMLIEPYFENVFVDNSYGYRPNKGHYKAVQRTWNECKKKQYNFFLQLDIDDYFDAINHDYLAAQVRNIVPDEEIVRLVMLAIQMGVVSRSLKWQDVCAGVPQGAILSPLLSNLYLTPFDKFVRTLRVGYVRYADDFVVLCSDYEKVDFILDKITGFLRDNLHLCLNKPVVKSTKEGIEFLGIFIREEDLSISPQKQLDLRKKIDAIEFTVKGVRSKDLQVLEGIKRYYAQIVGQDYLRQLDDCLFEKIKLWVKTHVAEIKNKTVLSRLLQGVPFQSLEYQLYKSRVIFDVTELYIQQKTLEKGAQTNRQNKEQILQRKKEYHKRERENKELLISSPGSFLGLTSRGFTVKQRGKVVYQQPIGALTHITVAGKGITLSSNLIDYCLAHKITIDFFNSSGGHTGSILSNKYMECTLWNKQAACGIEKRNRLAVTIIWGKLHNQLALIKYFHKYHKKHYSQLDQKYKAFIEFFKNFQVSLKSNCCEKEMLITHLTGSEAQGAIYYWNYIHSLLVDDDIGFEKRIRKGATDLVNMMLNYGYAILYNRVWQALLGAKLNPFDSIIHYRQVGKPTFVYDMVEIFRAQVVDRVVITLVQRGFPLRAEKGLLDDATRRLLSQSILDRLNRYENYRGEEITLEDIIRRQMGEIARFIEKDVKYKPYIAKW
ncbi:CRISPR-associated endonuclease Cas1 [Barnesiella viscericola]|uniref:CRISPR-associated endonuclease Cas1 n=1 Tax=Barnesiella viscericola TaxID=397865 RepID=UPI0025A48A92|nr:CRISPR-associated endonuclease Cas1 [Barnesiella viscericola]MDM8270016.1 CRISPR-associated endonuclease Cas1 [Barnesiella viscericola]